MSDSLPWFWEPFHSYAFAIFAGVAVPVVVAFLIGWFVFRARVNGVYVAIITLAMLVVINLLIIDQQSIPAASTASPISRRSTSSASISMPTARLSITSRRSPYRFPVSWFGAYQQQDRPDPAGHPR